MIQNMNDSFKEKIDLFHQLVTLDAQFERLLKIEPMYYTLSKKDQELIYEEFKRLLNLKHEKDKYSIDDFFFGEGTSEIVESNYCNSKLYQILLHRHVNEEVNKALEFYNEIRKLPEEKQKEVYEGIKRKIKKIFEEQDKNNKEKEKRL